MAKVGRPRKYTDPKVMEQKIEEYFESITDENGDYKRPPTVSGLALFLGFCNKSSMYDYRDEYPEFSDSIKKAIARLETFHEEKVSAGDKCVGNIFILKNFGWSDRQQTVIEIEQPEEVLSFEEVKARIKEIEDAGDGLCFEM